MNDYEEEIKRLQAKAMADLRSELAKRPPDPLAAEHDAFLAALVKARLKKGISQAELAARLGTRQPAIARIETGHGNPGLRALLAIAKALDANLMLK